MNKINILYIEDDPNIAEIYSLMIQENFENVEIFHFVDGLKATQELKKEQNKFQLIISDYKLPNITGGQVFQFVNGQMLGVPFILLSGFDCTGESEFSNFFLSHVRNAILVKPVMAEELVEKIKWCLEGETNLLKIYSKKEISYDEKIPVSSDIFLKVNLVPCDIYLRLSDGKYVKIINKKEIFERSLIQKLIIKGVNHFFVNRSELSKYSESVISSFAGIVKTKRLKGDDIQKSQLNSKAIDLLKGNLMKCGFSNSLLEATDEVVELQMQLIKSTKELNDFLEKFQLFRKSASDHSRIVNYIMVAILRDLTWDSEATLHRMSVASLLHDITLPDIFLKKILSDNQVSELQEADQQLFLRHPEEAAHLAKNFEKIASGIEQYIVEHHELPDGKGFPRKLTYNQIHPLSAVLHLADFVADLMMEYNFEMNTVAEKINEKKLYYLRGFYRKPFEAILRIFKINLK